MKDLDRAVALEIEAKIVPALNEAWPESHGDEQTWEDKREAARGELMSRYPDESDDQIEAYLDAFQQDYCARLLPFQTIADYELRDAAPAMLEALERIAAGDPENMRFAILAISEARAAIAAARRG